MQQSQESSIETFKQQDSKLNKTALDFLAYGAIGYGVGLLSSLIFKKGMKMKYIGFGVGAGISLSMNDVNLFKRQDLDNKMCWLYEKHFQNDQD